LGEPMATASPASDKAGPNGKDIEAIEDVA